MAKKQESKEPMSEELNDIKGLIHPSKDGFREKVTPKDIEDEKLFIWKCACGHQHLRHAGYMRVMMPYMESGGEKKMTCEPYQVFICVSCKKASMWYNGQMYDVTDHVDLKAWEKTEKESHKATGPGGQC
jgi:hypothetical protein